ncbi:response regulator transcription factor [Salinimonas sp. HHU 13199]|uniref:Response regulator transcription factor n=1 Tax=Salinimonas profundi TaxID=2729140 RepID=A0ABR8LGV9_9ALTE|nr:response regulator transcription factor [Salinimonas profundi]MBD3584947.1 response regulator transcription factor [Salinimonas profundi]
MKILIADDEQQLSGFLKRGLESEHFECKVENQIDNLVTSARRFQPDIILLDRMFGDMDSITVLEYLKKLPEEPLILLLTAVDDVKDRVEGLKAGADDYLCKPFDFDELLARLQALSRRRAPLNSSQAHGHKVGNLILDTDSRVVSVNENELTLTKLEYDLLLYLAENIGKVLSRERILSRVWKAHSDPLTNVVDVYISRLRKQLPAESRVVLETLRGNGYRLKEIN